MAQKFLLTVKLKTQGSIIGSSTRKEGALDFSKGMECHGFKYGVAAQYDVGSGALTGRRRHTPITIVREVDSASPLLWQALCTNETFTTATLSFNRPSPDGKPALFHTIELTNAAIIGIKLTTDSSGKKCHNVALAYDALLGDGAIPYLP
jgi:type VI secretion system secreted protein Hcp